MKGLIIFALGAVVGAAVTSYSERQRMLEAAKKLPPPSQPEQNESWARRVIKLAECLKKGQDYEFDFLTGECKPKGRMRA